MPTTERTVARAIHDAASPRASSLAPILATLGLATALALVPTLALPASHTESVEGQPSPAPTDAQTTDADGSDSKPVAEELVENAPEMFEEGFDSLSYGERTGGAQMVANMIDREGNKIGRATFSMTPSGIVVVRSEVSGLDDGEHGLHIHEVGECDPSTGFQSAGGHYAGEGDPAHGLVEGGPHAGDLPNVIVRGGTFAVEHFNPRVTLTGDMNPLADEDGSAIIVHSQPDDYESQPSGDAGERVACGVIAGNT